MVGLGWEVAGTGSPRGRGPELLSQTGPPRASTVPEMSRMGQLGQDTASPAWGPREGREGREGGQEEGGPE